MRWGIWCRVSGGVTGTREAWLKDKDGGIAEWLERSNAEGEARKLNEKMNGNPYRRCDFHYEAMRL